MHEQERRRRPPLRGRSPRPARSRHSPAVERSDRRGFAAADRFELERPYRRGFVQAKPGPGLVLRVEHSHRRSFLGAAHRRSPQRTAQAQGADRPDADAPHVDSTPIDRLAGHQLGRRRNRSGPRSARPDAPVRPSSSTQDDTTAEVGSPLHEPRPHGRKRAFQGWPAYDCPGALCLREVMEEN